MSPIVQLNLGALLAIIVYYIIRIIGISDFSMSSWTLIYWGNVVKDSFLLFIFLILSYHFFNLTRHNSKTGPTIIIGRKLKSFLFLTMIVLWSAIIIRMVSDAIKIALPLEDCASSRNALKTGSSSLHSPQQLHFSAISTVFLVASGISANKSHI